MVDFTFNNTEDCGCDNNPTPLRVNFDTNCNESAQATSVAWSAITGLPSCFVPCAHTHTSSQITDLATYLLANEKVDGVNDTSTIDLTLSGKKISGDLKISGDGSTDYKIIFQTRADGLFAELPYASLTTEGLLSAFDWTTFNNKFDTPSGTTLEYVAGDGSILTFPTTLPPSGIAGGDLLGTYPNPNVIWANGYTDYDARYYSTTNPNNYISFVDALGSLPLVNSIISPSDNIISAFGKTQAQINSKWTKPSFTTGSVLFWGASDVDQNNSKFFWDNTLFKLKLTDSKLEFLNTSLLGSSLLEYKDLGSVANTVLDQTNNTVHNFLKIRSYDSWSSGLHFGTIDGIDTISGQVGLTYNSIGIIGASNQLLINNLYHSTGSIRIQASAYTQIDGLAIKQSFTHTFNEASSRIAAIIYPYNVCRFNYGDSSGPSLTVRLPYSVDLPIPDGYIVIIKALNTIGSYLTVPVSVNPSSGQTLEAFTFNADYQSVVYRYNLVSNHWDIIAKF